MNLEWSVKDDKVQEGWFLVNILNDFCVACVSDPEYLDY